MTVVLTLIFILCAIAQGIVWIFLIEPVVKSQDQLTTKNSGVSVIIAAKNEASALAQNLPLVLDQEYHEFEVIVVDDHSTDQTLKVLSAFKNKFSGQLVVLSLPEGTNGKKKAIQAGLAASRFQDLLLTDADCRPLTSHWIASMTASLTERKKIVLGASPVIPAAGFASHFHAFDVIYITVLYMSMASKGMPYMGVGRNIAYRKEIFHCLPGHYFEESSGDDDLLVNHAATRENTTTAACPSAMTTSPAVPNWKTFLRQKIRHFSVSYHYKIAHKILLTLIALSHWLFLFTAILLVFTPWIWIVLTLYVLRIFIIYFKTLHAFRQISQPLPLLVPIFDLMYLPYYPLTFLLMIRRPGYKWR